MNAVDQVATTGVRIALATVCETRDRFYAIRSPLIEEEVVSLDWLAAEYDVLPSEPIRTIEALKDFLGSIREFHPHLLIIHIPVWTDPILSVTLAEGVSCPVMLLGNMRKETSSMVGLFGGGGSLDQIGIRHWRCLDHRSESGRSDIRSKVEAAFALRELQGQRMGVFGGRSLGMVTATGDPAQWMKLFGVDMVHVDQLAIRDRAESQIPDEVEDFLHWFESRVMSITFSGMFDRPSLERQVRSYMATRAIAEEEGFNFIGVKCQPELADGYTTQCVAHMLSNGTNDDRGRKQSLVHACEADLDGALTMQILKLISGGAATALLDMRWTDLDSGVWTLANCGAIAADFAADTDDPTGLSAVEVAPHVIGEVGGCGLPMMAGPGTVTLARLCRTDGDYWMAIMEGTILEKSHADLKDATAVFPQAYIQTGTDSEFLRSFGSNHSHMVKGRYTEALISFCELAGIPSRVWRQE